MPAHLPQHTHTATSPSTPLLDARQEKAAWQKQQRALEAAADKARRAAEEARERLAEQEAALKSVGAERRASQQDRRQAEADAKAREAKLAAALEEARRLRCALEEARGAQTERAGVSREEAARLAADNRQLAAQVQGPSGCGGRSGHRRGRHGFGAHCSTCSPALLVPCTHIHIHHRRSRSWWWRCARRGA